MLLHFCFCPGNLFFSFVFYFLQGKSQLRIQKSRGKTIWTQNRQRLLKQPHKAMGKDLNRHLSKRHIQIAKIIQKCTTRKSRIKIMRYPTTPISSAKFQIYDNIKCWRVRSNRNPPSLLVGCMYSHSVRQLCGFFFFSKAKEVSPWYPTIILSVFARLL